MLATLAAQLIAVTWSTFDTSHLLAIIAAAVLVGLAEETLFRGIILGDLRNGTRSEGMAVLWSSLWFGLFNCPSSSSEPARPPSSPAPSPPSPALAST